MLGALATRLFGSANDRTLKPFRKRVDAINALEPQMQALDDDGLRGVTEDLRRRVAGGESLDDVLVPAFALVREASRRVLGLRHFDVQLIGGMVLHSGRIAEMRTGEGKTLVSTLPAFLNALAGKGVHVVTVNEYLAARDAETMGRVHTHLGLSVGVIASSMDPESRARAYACDITYGTNTEFGFDYLRDNLAIHPGMVVQRGHAYAIVDEVDSILIDEARTPLIISGQSEDRTQHFLAVDDIVRALGEGDVEIDEKMKAAMLTDEGTGRAETLLREAGLMPEGDLVDPRNVTLAMHMDQSLRAHRLNQRDKQYVVLDDKIVIVDEFSGRLMPGRRYGGGLHQAIEAKERVTIEPETQTLASTSYQNYFRLYGKLSGMTGTAATEADEFTDIFKLDVVVIPTNRPVARIDEDDAIYRTMAEKLSAIADEITDAAKCLQPVLVGTTSIQSSEEVAKLLESRGMRRIDFGQPGALEALYAAARSGAAPNSFAVLNARSHAQEANIVAQAGIPGAVTIATNMAGRGTDIQLGGNVEMRVAQQAAEIGADPSPEYVAEVERETKDFRGKAVAAGGLYVIGTERHESRRIDNQLRGRSGRQGDPGRSCFFVSLEDDLQRVFGGPLERLVDGLGITEGEAISHPWISKAIAKSQERIEQRNFQIRKEMIRYDDVVNEQRKAIFRNRQEVLTSENLRPMIDDMRQTAIEALVARHIPAESYPEQWDVAGLTAGVKARLQLDLPIAEWAQEEGIGDEELHQRVADAANASYLERIARNTEFAHALVERRIVLMMLDMLWREQIETLDHLRTVVGWRSVGQRDPLQEFRHEAFTMFDDMLDRLAEAVTLHTMSANVRLQPAEAAA